MYKVQGAATPNTDHAVRRLTTMAKTDPQLARAVPDAKVTAKLRAPNLSYRDVIATALSGYGDRPALGMRTCEVIHDSNGGRSERRYSSKFTTTTYAQLLSQVEAIASFWQNDPQHRVAPGDFIASITFNGQEFTATDLACPYAQAVSVPLQANLPTNDLRSILEEVAPVTLIASIDNLQVALEHALRQPTIRSLIVLDADERVNSDREQIAVARERIAAAEGRLTLATFKNMIDAGSRKNWRPVPTSKRGTDRIAMIVYTSGSTGTPKGAMIHEAVLMQFWTDIERPQPTISIAYGPMNHFIGRDMVFHALAQGGTAYFSLKSDMSTLLEDIRIVRPTWIIFFPRLVELVHQHYLAETQRRTTKGIGRIEAERQVLEEMRRSYLGDRLTSGCTGSAPTSRESRAFISECFGIDFPEGYGSTEAGGCPLTWSNIVQRPNVIDYRLRDVPELGYFTTDRPYPRGELVIRTRLQIQGYFNRPEATAGMCDENGYVITGDIMEERAPDEIHWIDRRNNVIKLSQAEFVAIGPLELKYLASGPLIKQIYLYGRSCRSFLLAVVVPDITVANVELGHPASDAELRLLVLKQVQDTARIDGLRSFEVPRDILIEREPFTLENGLLSSVRKPLRPKLRIRYSERLDAMYEDIDRTQKEKLKQLRGNEANLSTLDRVTEALKTCLGLEGIASDTSQCFRDMGGDSLGAVTLSLLLEDLFKTKVSVSVILNPAGHPRYLADCIDRSASKDNRPTFATVHGDSATEVHASDLTVDALLDTSSLKSSAAGLCTSAGSVLLTGATGFLGRFLCLEWMERLAPQGGKVICIVRAHNNDDARARLDAAIGNLDPALKARFQTLANRHLETLSADLAAPQLGLSSDSFARLADGVDHIVHAGALVNHRLSYQDLFEPNVVGTAELIRLALIGRKKPIDFISSAAVAYMSADLAAHGEDADVRRSAESMPLSSAYANGYGVSKWAGEVLLREAHENFGLPVNVFRPEMILSHSRFCGQINPTDTFTRTLFSVAITGLAPFSFYTLATDGSRAAAHYDGLPVDFLAAVIRQIGEQPHDDFRTYDAINLNYDDGISLDTIMDWVASAGYRIERITDYTQWHQRFKGRLEKLPPAQRARSALDILSFLAEPRPSDLARLPCKNFSNALRSVQNKPEVPSLTEAFVHKSLNDIQLLGFFRDRNG